MNKKLGGVEQAFLDYNDALLLENHQVINITSAFAKINKKINSIKLPNLNSWCFFSRIYLQILIFWHKPDVIIAHGGRAVKFSCAFDKKNVPVIGVSHSRGTKYIVKCDYIIALNESLKELLIGHQYSPSRICVVPNMVKIVYDGLQRRFEKKEIYTIGALGRLVNEKGFADLIEAIGILKNKSYNIKLKLGGDGELKQDLLKLVSTLNLEKHIEFVGWVVDKKQFFEEIDVFCVPSLIETFGIVALESMLYQVPTVATKTLGSSNIFEDKIDGLLVEIADANLIAKAIAKMIDDPEKTNKMVANAYNKILNTYDINIVSKKLSSFLGKFLTQEQN